MNNKIKSKTILFIILVLAILTIGIQVNAYSASPTNVSLNVGETKTITVTANNEVVQINATSSNSGVATVSGGPADRILDSEENSTKSTTYTIKAVSAGSATITFGVDDYSSYGNGTASSLKVNVTVTNPSTPTPTPAPTQSGGNNGNSSSGSSTTTTAPTFKSANKTVYSVGDINLRASWSTSSAATRVKKDTEMTLTGTSTEKINGYIWYRVSYQGQTKYVSRDLVTETKPETDENKEEEKSNNNNLKLLEISAIELDPEFDKDKTEYTAKIQNYKEKELNVKAEAEDEKATVKIEGNNDIRIGENKIVIRVTAEDGTEKLYTITLNNEETDAFGLSSLKIKDVDLKGFRTDKYDYEIRFSNVDKLEIEAIANEEGATIEIIGNEDLKDGENIITIVVTSKDGEKNATYQIKAIKSALLIAKQINYKSIMISALLALLVLVLIITLIVIYVKNKNRDYDEDDEDFEDYEKDDSLNNFENNKKIQEENTDAEFGEDMNTPDEEDDDTDDDFDDYPRRRGKGRHSK